MDDALVAIASFNAVLASAVVEQGRREVAKRRHSIQVAEQLERQEVRRLYSDAMLGEIHSTYSALHSSLAHLRYLAAAYHADADHSRSRRRRCSCHRETGAPCSCGPSAALIDGVPSATCCCGGNRAAGYAASVPVRYSPSKLLVVAGDRSRRKDFAVVTVRRCFFIIRASAIGWAATHVLLPLH